MEKREGLEAENGEESDDEESGSSYDDDANESEAPPVPVPAKVLKPRRGTSRQKEDDLPNGLRQLPKGSRSSSHHDRSTSPLPQKKMPALKLQKVVAAPSWISTSRSSGNDESNGTALSHKDKKDRKDEKHRKEKDRTPRSEVQAEPVASEVQAGPVTAAVQADSVQSDVQADSVQSGVEAADWDPDTEFKHSIATFFNMEKRHRNSKMQVSSIQCYTVAWRALNFDYMTNINDDRWVSEFFKRYGERYRKEGTPDLIIDCRLFSWPHGPKGHTGVHGRALLQCESPHSLSRMVEGGQGEIPEIGALAGWTASEDRIHLRCWR